jgi:hypothetical protein
MTVGKIGRRAESGAASDAAPLPPSQGTVVALATTPVKGLHLNSARELLLERHGVVDNRRFYVIDKRARMVNGKLLGTLGAVHADYDHAARWLALTFPGGERVEGEVRLGPEMETRFFSSTRMAPRVIGPWSEALSSYAGMELALVEADAASGGAVDRGASGAVSLISRASVTRLEAVADGRAVDSRRFRMLIEVEGPAAHEEDDWVGRTVRIGGALVAVHGHVGRCLVTTQSPDTGISDLPTLELLGYRRGLGTTEPLAFGVYGEVTEPGAVRLGDALTLA